jgi:hypothetical protein
MDRQVFMSNVDIQYGDFMLKKYYVYTHSCKKTGKVIYVGSGNEKRPYDLQNRSYKNWIKENGSPEVNIIKEFYDKNESLIFEKELTLKLKENNEAIFNERNGNYWDENNKLKLKIIHTGKKLTDEWKENIRLSHLGEKNHFFGKKHNEETKKIISEKIKELHKYSSFRLGKKHTVESKNKMSISQRKSMTKERIMKMSKARIGKKPANIKKVICLNTGIIYESTWEASKMTGCSQSKISEVCNNVHKETKKHIFRYYEVKNEN